MININDNEKLNEDDILWELDASLEDSEEDFDYYYAQEDDRDDYNWSEMSYNIPAITGWDAYQDYEDLSPM